MFQLFEIQYKIFGRQRDVSTELDETERRSGKWGSNVMVTESEVVCGAECVV